MRDATSETPRLLLAGAASGVGKTTFTVGLGAALRARGHHVLPFKTGPDYLDPGYHARAAGRQSHNLDGWMMGRDAVLSTMRSSAAAASHRDVIALLEGAMGLFDGVSPTSDVGSSAEIAKWTQTPIVLVLDASGAARTAAAVAMGVAHFSRDVNVVGVLCNRVGSRSHLELLASAFALTDLRLFGGLPRDPDILFPERHLGLRTASEDVLPDAKLAHLAAQIEEWVDVAGLLNAANSAPDLPTPQATPAVSIPKRHRTPCRIAIARDAAFHFYYEENLRLMREAGATLVPFSPIHDHVLPEDVGGVYLGGGYPEVYADQLSANTSMRTNLAAFANDGGLIYAECGGLMYLTEAILTLDDRRHKMVGLLAGTAVMEQRLVALGYVEVETTSDTALGPAGSRFRGHQFRYSTLTRDEAPERDVQDLAYRVRRRRGGAVFEEGYLRGRVLGSYVHAHWASNPGIASSLVDACRATRVPQ